MWLFCLGVSLFFQKLDNLLLELALYKYLAILDAAAYTAFCLEQFAQLFYILVGADEVLYQCHGLASAVVFLYAYPELLLLLGQGLIFLLFIGGIFEIRVGRVYDVQPLFPVVLLCCHFCCVGLCRLLSYNIFVTNFIAS